MEPRLDYGATKEQAAALGFLGGGTATAAADDGARRERGRPVGGRVRLLRAPEQRQRLRLLLGRLGTRRRPPAFLDELNMLLALAAVVLAVVLATTVAAVNARATGCALAQAGGRTSAGASGRAITGVARSGSVVSAARCLGHIVAGRHCDGRPTNALLQHPEHEALPVGQHILEILLPPNLPPRDLACPMAQHLDDAIELERRPCSEQRFARQTLHPDWTPELGLARLRSVACVESASRHFAHHPRDGIAHLLARLGLIHA
mmetsp:Transcript_31132/g.99573  ORF Transcript_31132/g.99573 Transcript_31132/m.99573 type:complete len:262 (+) Transcript_31132:250-1035(+)